MSWSTKTNANASQVRTDDDNTVIVPSATEGSDYKSILTTSAVELYMIWIHSWANFPSQFKFKLKNESPCSFLSKWVYTYTLHFTFSLTLTSIWNNYHHILLILSLECFFLPKFLLGSVLQETKGVGLLTLNDLILSFLPPCNFIVIPLLFTSTI